MSPKECGVELAEQIQKAVTESVNDICGSLGVSIQDVLLEWIALLLWIASKEIQDSLPRTYVQATIDSTFSCTLFFLEEADIGGRISDFTPESFQSFVHSRFETY